ncbi:hypothetical protein Tco_0633768 [Tanacetum coccineum]
MFRIQIAEIHKEVLRYLPVSGIIGLIVWWEMFFILDNESTPLLPTQINMTSLRYMVYAGKDYNERDDRSTKGKSLDIGSNPILEPLGYDALLLEYHGIEYSDLLEAPEKLFQPSGQDERVITTLAFMLEFPLASLTSLSLALLLFTTMAVSLSTRA